MNKRPAFASLLIVAIVGSAAFASGSEPVACCLGQICGCEEIPEEDCDALGGLTNGNESCDNVVCDFFFGACCVDYGCADTNDELECNQLNGIYLGMCTTCGPYAGSDYIVSAPGSTPIPDGDAEGVTREINFGEVFPLFEVQVSLDISHPRVGDLCVTLEHGGTEVTLVQRIGDLALGCAGGCCGCEGADLVVTLKDFAFTSVDMCPGSGTGPSGDVRPHEPLSAFAGQVASGAWNLTVRDVVAGEFGTINNIELIIIEPSNSGPVEFCELEGCGDGIVQPGEECDDDNTNDGDCCSSTCTFENPGSPCGDGPTECSAQDTCDGAGACVVNDLPSGTECGSGPSECRDQDTCDGFGICEVNYLPSGAPCGSPGDPFECIEPDSCTGGGVCQPGGYIEVCGVADGCCNANAGCGFEDPDCEAAPAVSSWGLLILALLLMSFAKSASMRGLLDPTTI